MRTLFLSFVVFSAATPIRGFAQDDPKKAHDWEGSIKVADDESAAELPRLLRLATLADAEKAALLSLGQNGEPPKGAVARKVELDVMNHSLVYSVEVIDAAEKRTSVVIVDAGNGKVLDSASKAHAWQGSTRVEWKSTIAEVEKAALGGVEGNESKKKAIEAEVEVVNGYIVYEVAIILTDQPKEFVAVVDANTAKVLAVEEADQGDGD
jgi:uncharacterized membrane protein YkoI